MDNADINHISSSPRHNTLIMVYSFKLTKSTDQDEVTVKRTLLVVKLGHPCAGSGMQDAIVIEMNI